MKALAIVPQSFFSPKGTPLSVYYRAMVMAQSGVEIDILTYGKGEDVDIPGVRIFRIPHFSFLGSVKTGPSFLKLFLDMFLLIWAFALLARNRYKIVHAHEEGVFLALILKPLFRFQMIYDMHSSLPQQLVNFQFTKSKLLIGVFEWLESKSLENADAVITICPELAKHAIARLQDPNKHFLIENSIFDEVKLKKTSNRDLLNETSLPKSLPFDDRPVIVYAGTFEKYQGIEILIQAFQKVRENRPEAFLLMIGGSPEQVSRFQKLAHDLGLRDHCVFTGSLNQAQTRCLTSRATILTSPRTSGNNTPLKIYEQLASGIPLVATRILSHTQVLNDEICFLVDPNSGDMANGIVEVFTDSKKRQEKSENAKSLYRARYSRETYERKIRALLDRLHSSNVLRRLEDSEPKYHLEKPSSLER